MSLHRNIEPAASLRCSDVIISTSTDRWVIPCNCQVLKALLAEKNIQANDLRFNSDLQCHKFIQRLLLLAAQDECRNQAPSQLAELARFLIKNFNNSI